MKREKTIYTGVRIPVSLKRTLEIRAQKDETSESAIIRQAVRAFLSNKKEAK